MGDEGEVVDIWSTWSIGACGVLGRAGGRDIHFDKAFPCSRFQGGRIIKLLIRGNRTGHWLTRWIVFADIVGSEEAGDVTARCEGSDDENGLAGIVGSSAIKSRMYYLAWK